MKKLLPNFPLLLILTFFIISTLLFFFPLLKNFTGSLPDDSDGVVITWHLNKFVQNPTLNPKKLFQGNILYPYPFTQAYTDPFIIDSLIAYPLVKLTGEPVVAFNFNLILSQILLLFFTFLFIRQLSGNFGLSFLLSLIFGFSRIRLHYLGHLQMFSVYWVPLAGYFLLKLAESKKVIFIYLFFATLLLQTLNSFLPGYFILFMTLGMFIGIGDLRRVLVKNFKHTIIAGLLVLAILLPYIRIYFLVSSFFNYTRPIRDSINFSLSPEEIFTKFFSPIILLLFAFSAIYFFFVHRVKSAVIYLLLAMSGYILALGPALHFFGKTVKVLVPLINVWLPIPLPYTAVYYLLPGFNGFRTPSRWIFMFGFLAVSFAGLVMAKTIKNIPKNIQLFLFLAIGVILILVTTKIPKTYYQIPKTGDYPKVYGWLAKQPGRVVLEMPIYFWRNSVLVKKESFRMLYSLEHQKYLVNGTTGFTPSLVEKEVEYLQKVFPDSESLFYIKKLGVDYIIIHQSELADYWQDDFTKKITVLAQNKNLIKIYDDGTDFVYEFVNQN